MYSQFHQISGLQNVANEPTVTSLTMDTDEKLSWRYSFYDQEIGERLLNKTLRRPRASFDFVQHGRFEKQAEAMRLKVRTSACHAYLLCSCCTIITLSHSQFTTLQRTAILILLPCLLRTSQGSDCGLRLWCSISSCVPWALHQCETTSDTKQII